MTRRHLPVVAAIAAAAVLGVTSSARAADVDHKRLLDADKNPADWLTYHGTYKSWHYSGLDQINTEQRQEPEGGVEPRNADARRAACSRFRSWPTACCTTRGSYNQLFALDGATGELIWAYKHKLNEDLVAKQTHSPYNRGIALGYGNIYMGTLDGKLVADRHEDRQAQVGDQAGRFREADRGLHRRAAVRQRQGHHRLAGRRVAVSRPDLRRRRERPASRSGRSSPSAATTTTSPTRARPGAAIRGRPAAAAAGWPAATIRRPTPFTGAPRNPAPLYDWGGAGLEDRRARVRATTCTRPR